MKNPLLIMGLFGLFGKSDKKKDLDSFETKSEEKIVATQQHKLNWEEQMKIFNSLGYYLNEGITKELMFREIYEYDDPEQDFIDHPFSRLYYFLGWSGGSDISYNYTDKCIWFDLEFFDPNSQYKWFMQRMGKITDGEIEFADIELTTDKEGYEWISFKANGIKKKWKLEKSRYISDSFVQRFSYLPAELKTIGRYTYFDDGGQQWVIDYATEEEQNKFIAKTGLKREWLGEGNHFSEPKE